jgi:SAM-dependent methyltransferase
MADGERPPWAFLDVLAGEPFFVEYKARVRELLSLGPGKRHLDVGGGVGTDAAAIAEVTGFAAVVEPRSTHATEARRRGSTVVVGDGIELPFRTAMFDSCIADRVLQHVDSPATFVGEIARVLCPGGRLVVVDPDLDTQVINLDATDLARRIFRFRADQLRPSGTVARRSAGIFRRVGLDDISVEARTLIVRDPARVDNVMGLRDWASFAHRAGVISADEARAWPTMIDDAAANGEFLYAVTYFITSATKPSSTTSPG